ncbi:hypothetical protein EDD11_000509 [Mortierella claussenii]|nr:hypothetical protein EDD11_000509 [Mortierella claussenii]
MKILGPRAVTSKKRQQLHQQQRCSPRIASPSLPSYRQAWKVDQDQEHEKASILLLTSSAIQSLQQAASIGNVDDDNYNSDVVLESSTDSNMIMDADSDMYRDVDMVMHKCSSNIDIHAISAPKLQGGGENAAESRSSSSSLSLSSPSLSVSMASFSSSSERYTLAPPFGAVFSTLLPDLSPNNHIAASQCNKNTPSSAVRTALMSEAVDQAARKRRIERDAARRRQDGSHDGILLVLKWRRRKARAKAKDLRKQVLLKNAQQLCK